MALRLFDHKGTPLDQQRFTWREMTPKPISKLDDDAFTRVRIILMNGIEAEALRFGHAAARLWGDIRGPLAEVRRIEQHQETMVNWLLGADHSAIETTIAYEQVAIEVTAALARTEPDPYVAQALRFAMLEDFDHLYRYSALMDRLSGMDPNNILQCYTDILPGRPTAVEHRAPQDDLRRPWDKNTAQPITKLHTMTIVAGEQQTHDYYMNIGPTFADPIARQLYAEIASIEEQHVTHYECLLDPSQSLLEQWLLHEANEAYLYYGCMQQEENPRIKAIWERMLDYELGHFHVAAELLKKHERRDPQELFPNELPEPFPYQSNREFVREVLAREVDMRANGTEFVTLEQESRASVERRRHLNSHGVATEMVAADYRWIPGTELNRKAMSA
jgi:rubrerythrin